MQTEALIITQLFPDGAIELDSSVYLSGARLPNQGPTAGVRQRVETEWVPGGREPITQVLGVEYEDITLTGRWDDVEEDAGATRNRVRVLNQMVAMGIPVQLVWGRSWNREGVLLSFRETPDREDDIGWELVVRPTRIERFEQRPTQRRHRVPRAQLDAALIGAVIAGRAIAGIQNQTLGGLPAPKRPF